MKQKIIFTDQSTQSCHWRPNNNFDEPARHRTGARAINFGRILTTFEEQAITVVETTRHFHSSQIYFFKFLFFTSISVLIWIREKNLTWRSVLHSPSTHKNWFVKRKHFVLEKFFTEKRKISLSYLLQFLCNQKFLDITHKNELLLKM